MAIDLYRYPVTGAYGLQPHAERVTRHILHRFGAKNFPWVTGYRDPDGTEHPNRRSVDFGISPLDNNPRTPAEEKLGDDVVAYALANRAALGTEAIFWNGWETGYVTPLGQWIRQRWQPPDWMLGRVDYDPFHIAHPHIRFSEKAPKAPAPAPRPPAPGARELFTVEQLAQISGNTNRAKLATDRAALVPEMKRGGITTPKRVAAFLAETSHETDHYRTLEEYGDEAYFRSFLGDEWRYHGRGYIMNTWKAAYRRLSEVLGVDLVKNPDLLKRPDLAAKAAVWFWTENGLNAYADRGDTRAISGIVGAGSPEGVPNGLAERTRLHKKAKEVLVSTKPAAQVPMGGRNNDGYARVNIAALGKRDQVAAHALAALLWESGVPSTVTGDVPEAVESVSAKFLREPRGYRQLWILGRPALDACGEAARYARYPISAETDLYDFAGNGFVDTCRRVAAEAEKLSPGVREKFLALVDPATPAPPKPEPEPSPGPVVPPAPVNPTPDPELPEPVVPEPEPSDPVKRRLGAIEETLVKMDLSVMGLANRVGKLEEVGESEEATTYDRKEEDLTVPRRVRRQTGESMKDRPHKAYVAAAIPFVMMFLTWYATGEFNVEEVIFLLTSVLSGGGVYQQSNKPKE